MLRNKKLEFTTDGQITLYTSNSNGGFDNTDGLAQYQFVKNLNGDDVSLFFEIYYETDVVIDFTNQYIPLLFDKHHDLMYIVFSSDGLSHGVSEVGEYHLYCTFGGDFYFFPNQTTMDNYLVFDNEGNIIDIKITPFDDVTDSINTDTDQSTTSDLTTVDQKLDFIISQLSNFSFPTPPALEIDFSPLYFRFSQIDSTLSFIQSSESSIIQYLVSNASAVTSLQEGLQSNFSDNYPLWYQTANSVNELMQLNNVPNSIVGLENRLELLSSSVGAISTKIDTISPDIDFDPVLTQLTTIQGYTDMVESQLTTIQSSLSSISLGVDNAVVLTSLNGNGSKFRDGIEVVVSGRNGTFTVVASFVSAVTNESSYTIIYQLKQGSAFVFVPESLVTLVTPV